MSPPAIRPDDAAAARAETGVSLHVQTVAGLRWSGVSVAVRRLVTFAAAVALARLLPPEDFGVIAMAMVFVAFLELFRDIGTGIAIIQRPSVSPVLLSSVFWLNVALAAASALGLALAAPAIAALYGEPRVGPILQVLSVGVIASGASAVHVSLLTREMRFRRLAAAELVAAIAAAAGAVGLAFAGFGIWSLVCQVLATSTAGCVLAWLLSGWRPQLAFSRTALGEVLRFSLHVTGHGVVGFFARHADNLLVGRYLGAQQLGYYDLAYRIFLLPQHLLTWVVMRVSLPVYARLQDDHAAFRRAFLRASAGIALVVFPAMLGLMAVADLFVVAVFGERWRPAIPVLAILAPLGAVQAIGATANSIYQATGRGDLLLRWGLIASPVVVLSFVVGLHWGIVGVAASYALASAVLQYPALAIPFRLIGLRMSDFGRALAPALGCALGMLAAVALARPLVPAELAALARLAILAGVGTLAYGALTWRFNRPALRDATRLLRGRRPSRAPAATAPLGEP